ncbi:MAG TPA: cupin domain-containing protein [Bryobacteraceae bacterium]|nr:cupin domain-containing protein [Bryobacteraceae bacterium]
MTGVAEAVAARPFAGLSCTPIVRGEHSGGAYSMVEIAAEPSNGSPLHVSHEEDKAFYVVDGAFRIRIGDRVMTAGPGASVRVPRGVAHEFTSVGFDTGRLLLTVTPAGHEEMLEALDRLPRYPHPTQVSGVLERYGVELLSS